MNPKILLVEDDIEIVNMLRVPLEQANFTVAAVHDGEAAIDFISKQTPDLILLDLMLPKIDGLEVYRSVYRNNRTKNIPIIMLTAKAEEIDRIVGLELGADDYIAKPFSIREVILRVQAVLRRNHIPKDLSQVEGNWFKVHDVHIDIERRKVKCLSDDDSNPEVELTATEFDLLVMLAKSPGRVFSRNILMDQVWGQDYYGVDRTVDTHMSRLRRKLGTCGDHIQTVHGVGYRFKS